MVSLLIIFVTIIIVGSSTPFSVNPLCFSAQKEEQIFFVKSTSFWALVGRSNCFTGESAMQVTEVTSVSKPLTALSQITHEQLQHEFNFLRAEHLTKTMLNQGLITPDEYRLIMAENTVTFPTFISQIL